MLEGHRLYMFYSDFPLSLDRKRIPYGNANKLTDIFDDGKEAGF